MAEGWVHHRQPVLKVVISPHQNWMNTAQGKPELYVHPLPMWETDYAC